MSLLEVSKKAEGGYLFSVGGEGIILPALETRRFLKNSLEMMDSPMMDGVAEYGTKESRP